MKMLAKEILKIAKTLLRIELTFDRDEEKVNEMNRIHREVTGLLDRIRKNEHLETFINRVDDEGGMKLEIGISDHEAIEAIVDELVALAEKQAKKSDIKMKKVK